MDYLINLAGTALVSESFFYCGNRCVSLINRLIFLYYQANQKQRRPGQIK